MSREAVLLQWERKIEAAERRDGSGSERRVDGSAPAPVALRPVDDATKPEPRRFERRPPGASRSDQQRTGERRTITITGRPTPARRRRSVVESQLAQPDRIALWAFLLGLLLVIVAAGTAHG